MPIMRVEGVTYGVTNLEDCIRFYNDMELPRDAGPGPGATFRTPVNQFIRVLPHDAPGLAPPVEEGSTLREICWGVDNEAALETLARALEPDYPTRRGDDGSLYTVDPIGFGLRFMVTQPVKVNEPLPVYNYHRQYAPRLGVQTMPTKPDPIEIIHVAVDIPQSIKVEAHDFYLRRLKFKVTDDVRDIGLFTQCEGDIQHHNFFMCHRINKAGINHIATEVPNFDSVIYSAEIMINKGWKESRRLGRHIMGSDVYRFVYNPCGGRVEFGWDMDRMPKNFQSRVWEKRPGDQAIWELRGLAPSHD